MEEVTSSYTPHSVEEAVRAYWRAEDTYKKVQEQRESGKPFFFVDGPPYTTGYIHLGTAWNKILKDAILRYYRMKGRHVIDRAGYDMHGLPIEVRVENELGFQSKKDIETFGIAAFVEKCRTFAVTHKDIMSRQFSDLGVWLDFENPYETISNEYIEAAWYTLKRVDEEGMLERGYRVVNWCPRCETAIADAEVEYLDVTDPSIFVKFPVLERENEFLVIWTTTPWTLPANVAVAVSPDFLYARVRAIREGISEILWIAEELVESILKAGRYQDYEILEVRRGSDLVGTAYESPLVRSVPMQATIPHRVVAADFVAMENTGMVHIAPGHGWDDYVLGMKEKLRIVCPVDGRGRFTDEAGEFAGLAVKDPETNQLVIEALGDALLADRKMTHRYGHCWRCKTPNIFRATSQWFIKASEAKEQMLASIKDEVDWFPDWAGSARFHDWIEGARDWCISRQRYWGIPIPVWVCSSCETYRVIGRFSELEELSKTAVTDPHRPMVDEITFPCSCGGTMSRVEDIFDVWFDSGVASWATLGYPGREEEFQNLWPAEFITEGQDQTRGWFYSQLGLSQIAFGQAPYRQVLMHGFALDAAGKKMSKSFGNVVTPEEVIQTFGVDVLRFYMLSACAPWDDLKFNWDGVKTVNRALNILWNVYRFPIPYMRLDGFAPAAAPDGTYDPGTAAMIAESGAVEDQWLISKINSLAREVDAAMAEYHLHRATRKIQTFILDDLSRWYVQLVRPRMWLEEESVSKHQAYETMYYVMRSLIRITAPFVPHLAEEMYRNLKLDGDPASVHMLDWVGGDDALINRTIEDAMAVVQSFDDAVANARQAGRRKLRWPVSEVVVVTESEGVQTAVETLRSLCKARANARDVRVITGTWDRILWTPVPQMKKIGPEFGKEGALVRRAIEEADGNELKSAIGQTGSATIRAGEREIEITSDHVTFTEKLPENVYAALMPDASVYVDVTLTPDLESEGYAREVIRRVQEMRKQMDLQVNDSIDATISIGDERILNLLNGSTSWIANEIRAIKLVFTGDQPSEVQKTGLSSTWDIEGIEVTISLATAC
ncbi:MAG: isoleucine--tRNA ligase [Methanocalculus sp. MSAO_Arc1]|uniref:isoleucine--tRNA ligase n=1 Tax=Methanocalculus TaxID=71151 RepID=UPI000FEF3226|nr:isoleucine--tRNA ligase [Methanocalculus sp. MSAO_Arc1]MCP1662202.1 isoleucyl-tRNA synthetase [Methanocalculus sp. AMF5]RQD81728.1 MAG: isoleucine--tRNA ligase [Methanocalculus sp. MSAO_Arc1]